jgi:hypothetical protein
MGLPRLSADCERCAALCCVALSFERSPQFGCDKAGGVACAHLDPRQRCAIHADLAGRGFSGCARYDCLGAGQRVVQELFAGRSFHDEPALAPRMFEAFRRLRQLHELLLLLETASALALPAVVEARRRALCVALCPPAGFCEASLAELELGELSREVMTFLGSLREFVPTPLTPRHRLRVACADENAE